MNSNRSAREPGRLRTAAATAAAVVAACAMAVATGCDSSVPKPPANWPGVDTMIRLVAPQVRFLVAAVHGSTCRPVDAIGATTPAPLGSAFKLYVLDALVRRWPSVATGRRPGG